MRGGLVFFGLVAAAVWLPLSVTVLLLGALTVGAIVLGLLLR